MLLTLPFLVPENLLTPHPLLFVPLYTLRRWARAHSPSSDAKMRKINFNAQKMELLVQKVSKHNPFIYGTGDLGDFI